MTKRANKEAWEGNITTYSSSHFPVISMKDFFGVQCSQCELKEKTLLFRRPFRRTSGITKCLECVREQTRWLFVLRESNREQSKENLQGC